MRIPAFLVCSALTVSTVHADPLSAADREALLENLEKIRENADSRVDARFRLAIAAYREAMGSEEAAMEFYLKCIEKVNFEDQQKKNADFRDWKRKEDDHLKDMGFRLALRYQLRWLILTLRASSEKANRSELAVEAQEIVDAVFRDADKLEDQGQALNQPVTATVFARAYEIGNLEKNEWPLSPVDLGDIYEKIIFPPLRMPTRVESLRAAWIKRIQQEGIKIEIAGDNNNNGGGGGRRNGQPGPGPKSTVDHDRFVMERIPEFQWQMEMDLFRSGDEAGAAMRMLAHIEKHLAHKSARKWGQELKDLLAPKPATPVAPAGTQP
jgi:hypothetical protein